MSNTAAPALIDRLGGAGEPTTLDARIRAATLRCVARWGCTKTTLDDIAREAGCSRATIYRVFPGGKDSLLIATATHEIGSFFAALADELALVADLEAALVLGITEASRGIAAHQSLQYLLQHEPEVVLPYVAFDGLDPLLEWAAAFAVAHLARFVSADIAGEVGEWAARLVISYSFEPPAGLDLTDPDVTERLVRTYVLPGIATDRSQRPSSRSSRSSRSSL